MLYLHPPYYSYEGVTLLGDFHNPRQFYCFPNRPHLAVDDGRPAIRFIVLKEAQDELDENEEDVAGFLVFDTSLAWPQETLDKVARKLKEDLDLEDDPIIAPLPFKSGSVQLTFLDRSTPLPPEPGEETARSDDDEGGTPPEEPVADMEQPWVPFLKSSGVPSLYGENRAIFSVMLNRKATKLLYGAFEGFMPAGVLYNLNFVGMQRAFNVRVEADWERAYHFVQEQFKMDLFFYSHQTDDIIERLEEAKIVKIEASLEGVGEESMEAEFNDVREQLQELVLKTFFEPTVNPDKEEQSGFQETSDGIIESARKLRNLGFPNAGYMRREVDINDVKSISVDYTVSRAVERSIHPQAHLALFFEDFNIKREDIVTVVDGNDALWNTASFDAALNADFDGDGIHSVALDVQYTKVLNVGADVAVDPDALWSFLFDPQVNRIKREAWYNPDIGNNFFYRYTVFFKPGALPGRDNSLSSGWRRQDSQLVVLSPHELYEKRELEVQAVAGFPFDRYPQVWVHVAYEDVETGWKLEDSDLLSAGKPGFKFAFRRRADATPMVNYRFTYLRAGGEEVEGAWLSTGSDLVLVDDPVPDRLKVRVLVAGDRSKIANLLVDLKYEDLEHGLLETGSIILDSSNISKVHEWTVPLADPSKRRYSYNQTLIDTDGNVTFTDWQQSEKPTLTVGQVFVMQLEVQPELVGPPLPTNRVDAVKLRLRYQDEPHGVNLETERLFRTPGKSAPWQIQLKDAQARDYNYEVVYVMKNGFERTLGGRSSRDNFLMLSSVPPA